MSQVSSLSRYSGGVATVLFATALTIATPFVAGEEGFRTEAYLDVNGQPTICYGNTHYADGSAVKLGDHATKDECDILLSKDLLPAMIYITKTTTKPLNSFQLAAIGSFAYNCGTGTFQRSSIRTMIDQGNMTGACNKLLDYVYSGGKDCRIKANKCYGIVDRRIAENSLCLRK